VKCDVTKELTDAEIAGIVRAPAGLDLRDVRRQGSGGAP
jgi:hypothetical protein